MSTLKVFHSNRTTNFYIEHIKRTNPYYMAMKHYHPQYEIYYLLSGDRNYFIQDRVYNVQKGDLVLINSNVLHKTIDGYSESHERMLIEFDMSFFKDFLVESTHSQLLNVFHKDCTIFRLDEPQKKQLETCFYKMIQESKESNIDNNIPLKVYLLELLVLINKSYIKTSTGEFDHLSKLHKRVSEIVTYINLNYMNDIGLDLVAREFYISPEHLSRAFKKVTGFTFIEYLNNLRINEARKLLEQPMLSISDIATKVGYQNNTHFGRVFKSFTGSSPMAYRKRVSSN